jgi:hypothetical protein
VDVATVEADEQGQVRAGQRRPVSLAAVDEAGLLRAELVFQALRDGLGLPTDRGGVQGSTEGQQFGQQRGGHPVGRQGGELGL